MNARPIVLIIDDHPQNVEVLGECLSESYEIECAFSGAEALGIIAKYPPDLILLDVMMPGMDGYAVCEALKRDPLTQDIPLIFVTAKTDAESESRALSACAVDFIHKPINGDVVRARVKLQLALRARELELRQINEELDRCVEARTLALNDALFRAEAAHRAKHLFLANISHELRTPMTAILGLSELLSRQISEPSPRERVGKVASAGRQMLSLINDIIDYADLQANRIAISPSDFPPGSLLSMAVARWRPRAESKGLTLALSLDPALPECLRGDSLRLGQILCHFLSNAVKFSERGTILLSARQLAVENGGIVTRFEVEDQGIGIDEERLAAIFGAFEQADNSYTRRHNGAGLGLAISKQLAELMGGEIGVRSDMRQGSAFWVDLRLERGALPAAADPPEPRPEPEPPQPSSTINWSQANRVLVPLAGFLASSDVEAYVLWQNTGTLLDALLGERSGEFNRAMESFDFPAALSHLQAARAAHPELSVAASKPAP